MNAEEFQQQAEEIKRLNRNIKNFSGARDFFREQVRNFCKHDDDYAVCLMGKPDHKGRVQFLFICRICGEQRLVIDVPDTFPEDKKVSFEDFNTVVRDLGLK